VSQTAYRSMDLFRKPVPTPDQIRGRPFRDHALPDQAGIESDRRVICRPAMVGGVPAPLNRLVEVARHPFFVFSERRVCLLQTTELTRFVRRTRYVHEQCPEFGCFRPVLLCTQHLTGPFFCTQHLTGPFYGTRKYIDLPPTDTWVPSVGGEKGGWSCSSRSSLRPA
jgi:hypothetical protein